MVLDYEIEDAHRSLDHQQLLDWQRGWQVINPSGGSNLATAGTGSYEIDVAAGDVNLGGTIVSATQDTVDLVSEVDADEHVMAVIYRDSNGDAAYSAGTVESQKPFNEDVRSTFQPAPPPLGGTDGTVVAEVLIPPSSDASEITASEIRDRRIPASLVVDDLTVTGDSSGVYDTATIDDTDSPYTTQDEDVIYVDESSAAVTVTLATADVSLGNEIRVVNLTGTNTVTVNTEGAETIDPDGDASKTIDAAGWSVGFAGDGTNWDASVASEFESIGGEVAGGNTLTNLLGAGLEHASGALRVLSTIWDGTDLVADVNNSDTTTDTLTTNTSLTDASSNTISDFTGTNLAVSGGTLDATGLSTAVIDDTDSPFTTSDEDIIYVDESTAAVTVTLASADATLGNEIEVVNLTGTNTVTVNTEGAETIDPDGDASKAITKAGWAVRFVSDGTNWTAGVTGEFESVTTDEIGSNIWFNDAPVSGDYITWMGKGDGTSPDAPAILTGSVNGIAGDNTAVDLLDLNTGDARLASAWVIVSVRKQGGPDTRTDEVIMATFQGVTTTNTTTRAAPGATSYSISTTTLQVAIDDTGETYDAWALGIGAEVSN